MWLINTTTLRLEFFASSKETKYAILSHTWGGDEVDFQEFNHHSAFTRSKEGFVKIQKVCQLAGEYGLRHAWVDTCCIDKRSSSELSEAINSMFRWYTDAEVCFAYLTDLLLPSFPDVHDDLSLPQLLPRCRWFRRGWTLQELIAPRNLIFVDGSWQCRGSKEDLAETVSEITGIDREVLTSPAVMFSLPVARRMSWASARQTTREEDVAYCLLGIFDINMPLLYGEGPKAFMRLQEEIARQSCDISILGWTRAPGPDRAGCYSEGAKGSVLPDQPHYGAFARSPSNFAGCAGFRHVPTLQQYDQSFRITNRGFSIDALLIKNHPQGHILCIDVFDELRTPKFTNPLGIHLTKTELCFVRSSAAEVFRIPGGGLRDATSVVIPLTMKAEECKAVDRQYNGAVHIRKFPSGEFVWPDFRTSPKRLWDSNKKLFLTDTIRRGIQPVIYAENAYQASWASQPAVGMYFNVSPRQGFPNFLVACIYQPFGAVPELSCIIKNQTDECWRFFSESIDLCDKYFTGDNLHHLRWALRDDLTPNYSSTYHNEATGETFVCEVTKTVAPLRSWEDVHTLSTPDAINDDDVIFFLDVELKDGTGNPL